MPKILFENYAIEPIEPAPLTPPGSNKCNQKKKTRCPLKHGAKLKKCILGVNATHMFVQKYTLWFYITFTRFPKMLIKF